MDIGNVLEFLRGVSPFQELDEETLRMVAADVSMKFFPEGTAILREDGPPSEYLMIIKEGGVKVFLKSQEGDEVLIDYRGEGEILGFLSLFSGDRSRANILTVEDTVCYLISRETTKRLLDTCPPVRDFFHKSVLVKYVNKAVQEMRNKSLLYGGGDRLLFTTPLGDLVTREAITASQDMSIREVSEIMSHNRISSIVLLDTAGVPAGIVTDRDLRDKVISKGRSVGDKIGRIMSVSLVKADARDYCFEAILKMIRYDIHHLLVIDKGSLKGVVTNHDMMMLQGTSPLSIAREIESQLSIEGLVPVSRKINQIVELLVKEGARASNITRIITEINDRLLRKILEIAEKTLGYPPVGYCWISLGSEGRKEQTFKTDQDNAIIFADPRPEEEEEIRRYFAAFSHFVRDSLVQCGFPLCTANYMASNPQWCQPLSTWKRYFSKWIYTPTAEAVLNSLIFFDFRPIHGEVSLAEALRDSLRSMLEGQMIFLGYMANTIIKNVPPVGFFKSFIVEKSGEHKDELNLKIKGIAPFVDVVRLFSLERGVRETSTVERIHALREKHTIVKEYADELEYAFEFIMLLRIQHQFEQIRAGRQPDNFINPDKLSNLQRKTIKDSFGLITKMQGIIIDRYRPLIW